jgi:NAD(P)-dependent dehydrogenase (short-subunit alcohol dehydrogenase family)
MKRTVLITGCSSGIGKETALFFQGKGWNVAATMRSPEKENNLNRLENVKTFKLDVFDNDSIHAAVQDSLRYFGNVDVLVNHSGYGPMGSFEAAPKGKIEHPLGTNVFGDFNVSREVIPYFKENNNGTIINISSVITRTDFPCYSLDATTKHAMVGFSCSLSHELRKDNIKVKVILPAGGPSDFNASPGDLDYTKKVSEKSGDVVEEINPGPFMVAKVIFNAATADTLKARSSAGSSAKRLLFMRKIFR